MQHIKIVSKPIKSEAGVLAHIARLQTALDTMTANAQAFYNNFIMPDATNNGVTYYNVTLVSGGKLTTLSQLQAIQQDLQGDLDSMNEMSEMTSMRLQMAMDRRSKFVEILSNIEKKLADTQNAIVQNLK